MKDDGDAKGALPQIGLVLIITSVKSTHGRVPYIKAFMLKIV